MKVEMREETSNNAALASFPMNGVGLYPPPCTPWLGPPTQPSPPKLTKMVMVDDFFLSIHVEHAPTVYKELEDNTS